jgi:O-Antigen ligase
MPAVRVRSAAPVVIAALTAALAFDQAGFFPHSWVWAAVLFFWVAILALVFARDLRIDRPAAGLLAAFVLLTAWTLLSRIWSALPPQTLLEARRDLVYLAVGAAVLTACSRLGARNLVGALLVALELVVVAGLARYLTVSPRQRISGNQGALLYWPTGYANAIAALAAIAVPLGLALAAHARSRAVRAVAAAGVPPLVATLVLSGSRGGSIAAAAGALALLWLDPRRRSVGWAAVRLAGPIAVVVGACIWSRLTDSALAADEVRRGRIVVAAAVVVATAAAALANAGRQRPHRARVPSPRALAGVVLTALVLAALVAALPRLGGDRALRSLVGAERAAYWTTAWTEIDAHPAAGGGAGTFGLVWLEHGRVQEIGGALDDHNVYLETLAELGPPGLILLLLGLAAPLVAAPRAIAASRLGAAATAAYAGYTVDAFVEWDWELPAVTAAGLLLGGAVLVLGTRHGIKPLGPRMRTAAIAAVTALALLALLGLWSHTLPAATAAGAAAA